MSKIFITGTGRSGTTFLVRLFTLLGMNTGYTPENMENNVYKNANAGLEMDNFSPHIIKSPKFSLKMKQLNRDYQIEMVIVPIRDIEDATNSRERNGTRSGGYPGGIRNKNEMRDENYKRIAVLMQDLVLNDIPYILLNFNRMTTDSHYLYNQLKSLMGRYNIRPDKFRNAFDKANHLSRS